MSQALRLLLEPTLSRWAPTPLWAMRKEHENVEVDNDEVELTELTRDVGALVEAAKDLRVHGDSQPLLVEELRVPGLLDC